MGFNTRAHAAQSTVTIATMSMPLKTASALDPASPISEFAVAENKVVIAPGTGGNLRLAQALDSHGVRQPGSEKDSGVAGDTPHLDSNDIQVELGLTFDDNVSRGRLSAEKLSDKSVNVGIEKFMLFPLTDNTRVVVVGGVGGEKFHSYDGLDRIFASLNAELQYRASGEFSAPTLAAFGRLVGEQFQSKLRRGYRASLGVSVRQSVTDRIVVFGALAHNERFTKGDVFSTRDNSLRLNLDYALSNDSTLYLAGEHRRGDTVSSGQASLANIDVAKLFVLDDAFTARQTFAYKVDAETNIVTLGYNLAFGTRDSLDISWRRARATPTSRPTFNAPGPWSYTADQVSVVYLVRF